MADLETAESYVTSAASSIRGNLRTMYIALRVALLKYGRHDRGIQRELEATISEIQEFDQLVHGF